MKEEEGMGALEEKREMEKEEEKEGSVETVDHENLPVLSVCRLFPRFYDSLIDWKWCFGATRALVQKLDHSVSFGLFTIQLKVRFNVGRFLAIAWMEIWLRASRDEREENGSGEREQDKEQWSE